LFVDSRRWAVPCLVVGGCVPLAAGGEYPMQINADPLAAKIRDRRLRGSGRGAGQARWGSGALGLGQPTKAIIWSVEWRLHLRSERQLFFYASSWS
jgi:hypothetical protein